VVDESKVFVQDGSRELPVPPSESSVSLILLLTALDTRSSKSIALRDRYEQTCVLPKGGTGGVGSTQKGLETKIQNIHKYRGGKWKSTT